MGLVPCGAQVINPDTQLLNSVMVLNTQITRTYLQTQICGREPGKDAEAYDQCCYPVLEFTDAALMSHFL